MVCTFLRFLVVSGATVCYSAHINRGFLRNSSAVSRLVDASELELSLRESLEGAMGSGTWAHRSIEIERKMASTYQALPKNENGRLAPPAVRYIVHNYFQKEHGWLIEGLEPTGVRANASDLQGASIIQNKAPAILEALLEDRQADRGLTLQDSVAMMAALEHLIFDESITLLERAYALNNLKTADTLDEVSLHEVLRSYLLLFEQGQILNQSEIVNQTAASLFDGDLTRAGWQEIVMYAQDVQRDFDFNTKMLVNPFVQRTYNFEETSQMVVNLAEGYGKWQNADCVDMKEHLMKLDSKGTGRIPLDVFYRSDAGAAFEFTESREYLRDVGALDESLVSNPSVLIANYLAGPSNCIAPNSYYSVCCMSECEHLMNEIEAHVKGPTATSKQLLSLLSNMSSTTVDAPRTFAPSMITRLEQISDQNEGTIPVHGRLFGQWLHYAFPYECPLPVASANALTPSAWVNNIAAIGSQAERDEHIKVADAMGLSGEVIDSDWQEEEVLPLVEQPVRKRSGFRSFLQFAMMTSAIVFAFKSAYEQLQTALGTQQGPEWKDKKVRTVYDHLQKAIYTHGSDWNDKKCALPL